MPSKKSILLSFARKTAHNSPTLRIAVAFLLSAAPTVACSTSDVIHRHKAHGENGSETGSGANSGVGGSGGTALAGSGGTGSGGLKECAGEKHEGKVTPLDLVVMLDQSSSMSSTVGNGTTIWALVTEALTDFVQAPEAAGLGVGLNYFPLPDGGCDACNTCFSPNVQLTNQTNACCCSYSTGQACAVDGATCPTGGFCFQGQCFSGGANATCKAADYASLDVAIDLLPVNASKILTSVSNHGPQGLTPTAPALQGAIDAAMKRSNAHPDHTVAVVFASDGVPTECSPQDVGSIAAAASTAASASRPIRTFVIGIGDVAALNAIAQAGGTDKAYLVAANGNAGQQFLDAMTEIHGSLLACEFDIPPPDEGEVDYGLVNLELTPAGQPPQTIPQVENGAACTGGGGWYYDSPVDPKKIILCETSCDAAKSFDRATIEIVLGCKTIVK